jgi:hypothetical protein
MAAVGTLTIEMAANVARLSQDMQKATKTVDGAMSKIQRSVDVAKTAIVGLAGVLTIRQFSSFIKSSAAASEQLERMAFLANTSVADFQRMSLASNKFGISQEKLGDILKDTQDKVGDFMQTGGGAMADFFENIAPKVGVTADQFRKLNGKDALQLYVSSLEKANLSQSDMVFYMEAIASDSTLLLPLLRENGKAFEEIAIQAEKFGAVMDEQTIAASKDLNANLNSMNNFMDGVGISIYSALLPGLNALSDSFIKFAESSRIAQHAASAVLILFQTLAVVGSDVIFVIDQVVKGLVALVEAQYKLLSGNFSGAIKAFEDYNAQARDARTALDELQAEIMGLGKVSNDAQKPIEGLSNSFVSGAKAATELEKAYEALVKTLRSDITKSTAELQAEQQGLNTAQTDFLKLVSGDDWKQYSVAQKMLVTDLFKQKIETEQLIDLEKTRAKAAEDRLKKMLDDEKDFREELKKEDEKLAAEKLKKEEEFFAEQRKQIQQIEDQLTDALMRAFESGKGFGQAFKDTLINMFRTMVLRPILAPIVGGIAGGASGSAMAGTGTMDLISGATQMYSIVTTGFSKVGATVSAALQNAGDYLATSSIDAVAAGGEFLQTIAQGAGPISSAIAGAATGMFLNSLISGGYSMGKTMDTFQKIGIVVASFVGGPVLGAIVGAISGGLNLLFGRKLSDVGIEGTFGGSGFEGQSYKFYKGGLFKSDKTKRSPLDEELESFLGDSFLAIRGATAAMAVALGQSADSIFTFTKDIKLSFKGLKEEQIQALLTEQFELLGEELAQLALGTEEFTRRGESASETLQRLYQSVINVNSVFDTLGLSMFDLTLVGADMASQLVDLFGGIEGFVNSTTAYYEAFYTEAERTDILTRQLTTSFAQLGLQLPVSRIALRELIEAQDLTTQSGRELFASLMNLTPAFTAISKSTEQIEEEIRLLMDQATQRRTQESEARLRAEQKVLQDLENAYDNAQETVSNALATIERSINAQKQSLELSAKLGEEQIRNIQSVFEVLNNAILDLTGGGFTAITGQAFIQQALLAAQNTGYLPDPNELSRAISAARGGLTSGAGSAFEARRDQALLVARLTQLRAFAEDQLSTEEQTLRGIYFQIEQLDAQLSAAQEQVNVLRGINTGIRDIPTSIEALQASISNELKILAKLQAQRATATKPGGVPASPEAQPQTGGAGAPTLDTAGLEQTGPFPPTYDSNSITINKPAGQTGSTQSITIGGQKVDVLTLDLSAFGPGRGFAAGGLHSGGMRMVGERGPELEMTGPARYMSNANLASLMGNNNNEEVKQLREENKIQLRAMVSLQNRMTKIVEQWNNDGLPNERVEA